MSSFPVVGRITSSKSTKEEFEWDIPDVFAGFYYKSETRDSPTFYFLNAAWLLRIKTIIIDNYLWFSLYLVLQNTTSSQYTVTFTVSIKGLSVSHEFGPETHIFDETNPSCETKKFKRIELMEFRINKLNTSLVVHCDVVASKPTLSSTANQTNLFNNAAALSCNIQDLLISGRRSDVTISVRGQEFKAHRFILEARSPVFAAMFEHDMAEKKENIIKIEDCNPDVFQNFLKCVYGGSLENSTVEEIIRLYIVSHKYTVTDIIAKCAQFLEEELNEETVCDILALAKRYDETDLKNSAEEFMAQNMKKIISTQRWSKLTTENSLLEQYS